MDEEEDILAKEFDDIEIDHQSPRPTPPARPQRQMIQVQQNNLNNPLEQTVKSSLEDIPPPGYFAVRNKTSSSLPKQTHQNPADPESISRVPTYLTPAPSFPRGSAKKKNSESISGTPVNNSKEISTPNDLPTAPASKILNSVERNRLESVQKGKDETEKRKQENLARSQATEMKLSDIRRQYERESLARNRIDEAFQKRARHLAIAKECARRETFTQHTHESRITPPENLEIARELQDLPFHDGWRSVFKAFGADKEETSAKCTRSDDEIVTYLQKPHEDNILVLNDYLAVILEGVPPTPSLLKILASPPEQFDPDPNLRIPIHSLGKVMKAASLVFTSLMSVQMDLYSSRRRGEGLKDEDWQRLLNTATGHIDTLIAQYVNP